MNIIYIDKYTHTHTHTYMERSQILHFKLDNISFLTIQFCVLIQPQFHGTHFEVPEVGVQYVVTPLTSNVSLNY